MVERKLRRGWSTQASINIAKHEECLRWANRSGCTTLMVGLESLNEETLRRMGKRHQIKDVADGYARAMDAIRRSGIAVFGTIILGHDADDFGAAERTCEFMVNRGPDVGVCTILTPLPGTRLHARLSAEGRIVKNDYPADWALYDINEVVFRPKRLTMKELKECQVYIHDRVWRPRQVLRATLRTLWATRSPAATVVANRLNHAFQTTHWLRGAHREAVGISAPALLGEGGEDTSAGTGALVAEQPAPPGGLRQRTF
ncbi:MAG: B12-binding domain-containing radical SAM protein, partial [Armatimonadota bacterium]